jgi:hypothetical protein
MKRVPKITLLLAVPKAQYPRRPPQEGKNVVFLSWVKLT